MIGRIPSLDNLLATGASHATGEGVNLLPPPYPLEDPFKKKKLNHKQLPPPVPKKGVGSVHVDVYAPTLVSTSTSLQRRREDVA